MGFFLFFGFVGAGLYHRYLWINWILKKISLGPMQDTGILLNVLFLWIVNFSETLLYFLLRFILGKTIADLPLTFSEQVYCTFREFCIWPCVPKARPQRGQISGLWIDLSHWPYWFMTMWTCGWQDRCHIRPLKAWGHAEVTIIWDKEKYDPLLF